MRSTASSEKSTTKGAAVLAGYDIRRFWTVPALLGLFLLASCPVACLLTSAGTTSGRREFVEMMGKNEYVVCMVFFFVMAIAAAMGIFGYLQRQSEANLIHALPVSRTKLFATHYLVGLAMLFAPVLITGLVMMVFGIQPLMLIRWIVLSWLTCWAFYSIAVFASVVSGNVFMHLFNYVFFTFLPVMALAMLSWYGEMLLNGYTTPDLINRIMTVITPPVALFGVPSAARIVGYVIVSAALSLIAWKIYNRRAVENTGDSLVFSWTRLAVVAVVSFLGALAMGGMFWAVSELASPSGMRIALFAGIAIGFAATFLVISLIVYKGRNIFRRKNLMAGGAAMVATVLFIGGLSADLTGYGKVRFDPAEMDQVSISITETEGIIGSDRFDPAYYTFGNDESGLFFNQPITLKDPENIAAVCHIQNVLADGGSATGITGGVVSENDPNGEDFYGEFGLVGKKKSGVSIRRQYNNVNDMLWDKIRPDLEIIFQSAEFKDMFSLTHLRYGVNKIDISGYAKGTDDSLGGMNLSERQQETLLRALDQDLAGMTWSKYREMEKTSSETRPPKDYYSIGVELADEDETLLTITVTEDSPAAWAWIQKNFRPTDMEE